VPRKRKAARAFRKSTPDQETVRRKASNPFWLLMLSAENFHQELPTAGERRAFAELYPEKFYQLFWFEASEYDQYPASVQRASGCCVFRRERFETEFLREHSPRVPFDPPDLRGIRRNINEQQALLALARRAWWLANDWPMSKAERAWRDPREAVKVLQIERADERKHINE
jgi:hypothetical protein